VTPTAETAAQQQLLDLIAEELGGADWFDVESFKTYTWGTTPSDGRPVLFADEVFAFGTLPDGTLAGTMRHGTTVTMASFKDGRVRAHAPTLLGDPGLN
jgi:hypothetical protein